MILLFLLLVYEIWTYCFSAANRDRCSRQIQFLSSIEGYALKGHMIKNLSFETVGDCKSECVRDKRCVSINFGPMVCELNEHDHIQHPLNLTPWGNFTYHYTENACSSNPCLYKATCLSGFTDKGYRCLCPPCRTGEQCEKEKWEKLNSVPVCYGARDDAYGEFAFSEAGSIMKLTLTRINGFLSCNPMYPPSYWGCDHPSLAQGKLMTLVTFQNRTRLQPAKIVDTPCNPLYSINGSSLNSTSLSFEPFDIPLAAAVDDNFQIWFGQDFTNCSEENNAGVICVDVHALYS